MHTLLLLASLVGQAPPVASPQAPPAEAPPPPTVAAAKAPEPAPAPQAVTLKLTPAAPTPAPPPQTITLQVQAAPQPAPQPVTLTLQPSTPAPAAPAAPAQPAAVAAEVHRPGPLGRVAGCIGTKLSRLGMDRLYIPRAAAPQALVSTPVQQVVYTQPAPVQYMPAVTPIYQQPVTASPQALTAPHKGLFGRLR